MRIVRPRQPLALEIIARARRRSAAAERITAKGDGQATGERPQEGRTARRQRRAPRTPGKPRQRACSLILIKHGPSVLPLNADVNSERGANGDAP